MTTDIGTPSLEALRDLRREIGRLVREHHASNVRVFGSVVRGDAGPESDYDFVVDLDPNLGALEAFDNLDRLEGDLSQLLGRPTHVVTAAHDSAFTRRVLQDARPL